MFGYCGGAMGPGGWVVMIGLWGAVLAIAVWAVNRFFPADSRRDPQQDAAEHLQRRLATGEIAPRTYRQTRDELSSPGRR